MQCLRSLSRASLVVLAELTEQAERYDDMVHIMRTLVTTHPLPLSTPEINLLTTAYKHVIDRIRIAVRVVHAIDLQSSPKHTLGECTKLYERELELEYQRVCLEMLSLLEKYLLPSAQSSDCDTVCFLKTQGDYHRYLAELRGGSSDLQHIDRGRSSYSKAYALAKTCMTTTHAFRLGLALNYSVFVYEVLQEPQVAYDLAKDALDGAHMDFDETSPDASSDHVRETTLTLQLLQSNLQLWIANGNVTP
ncbi:hypothetical protein SDRG_02180 [Saprolegnia diclina VS20]|uniref:14-3-3 domain-containing protein n=1 Tax=Saprolegnia diclina (strain VS20) TaxID=1156394 RepID=T0QZY9_SAPDV|nr:hypothetical protein SDRG_02180 [Saprolegnia diclina VS20]EQC40276.1 hypothetical protein SDRG_02180 [Saprolegnia diclina VS20]|eukprot:XP_008605975.1 hypothetical protein SDRG_02180 [Saprolegnia diclina VS20]